MAAKMAAEMVAKRIPGSARRASALVLALLGLSVAPAAPALAQQAAPAAPATATADPELTSYAKAFLAVGFVRDDFNAQLALAKNKTVEHQSEIRQQMKEKVEQAIVSAGLSVEDYRRIEYTITVDPTRRSAFDQLLTELAR